MAVTVSAADVGDKPYYIVGSQKKTVKDVTLTGTYAAGGVEITAANLGLYNIDTVAVEIQTAANAVDSIATTQSNIDSTGGHIDVELWEETPAEITATDTVTGTILRVTAYGS
jgi:hypothetical protein